MHKTGCDKPCLRGHWDVASLHTMVRLGWVDAV